MQHDAVWTRRAQRELRDLLNDWDPIGVFDPEDGEGPLDEYDCIRDPLISHLLRGASRYEVAAFLREELTGHFGLQQRLVTTNVIDRIFSWWETVKQAHAAAVEDVSDPRRRRPRAMPHFATSEVHQGSARSGRPGIRHRRVARDGGVAQGSDAMVLSVLAEMIGAMRCEGQE